MKMPRKFLPFISLYTIISGCSVLKIDVDVYKGSLANKEEVQMEQLAAMAIAAQPLLTKLSEDLGNEISDPQKNASMKLQYASLQRIIESLIRLYYDQESVQETDEAQKTWRKLQSSVKQLNEDYTEENIGIADQAIKDINNSSLIRRLEPGNATKDAIKKLAAMFSDAKKLPPGKKDEELLKNIVTPAIQVDSYIQALSQEGRSSFGINTLVRNYIKNVEEEDKTTNINLLQTKNALMHELVRFAQKMLFIANYDAFFKDTSEKDKVSVLQAIGNSILVQTDELLQREEYTSQQNENANREYDAILSAYQVDVRSSVDEIFDKLTNFNGELFQDDPKKLKLDAAKKTVKEAEEKIRNNAGQKKTNKILITYTEIVASFREELKDKNDALTLLDTYHPPFIPFIASPNNKTTQRNVLDGVIAALRQEEIRATKEFGKDDPRTKNIANAINLAAQQRTNMIYIRQASSYLKSSYPTPLLQNTKGINGWDNLLIDRGLKNVPALNISYSNSLRRPLADTVDGQYWQNINTVQVSGGGSTSYAVVKDDIGNWYVKGYSSSPDSIINSAQSLALFNKGVKMNADLLGIANANKAGGQLPQNKQESWRSSTFTTQQSSFQSRSAVMYGKLKEKIDSYQTSFGNGGEISTKILDISPAQQKVKDKIASLNKTALMTLKYEESSKPETDSELGKKITQQLLVLNRFYRTYMTGIQGLRAADEKELQVATADYAQRNADKDTAKTVADGASSALEELKKDQATLNNLIDIYKGPGANANAQAEASARTEKLRKDAQITSATIVANDAKKASDDAITAATTAKTTLDKTKSETEQDLALFNQLALFAKANVIDPTSDLLVDWESTLKTYQNTVEVLAGRM